MSTPYFVVDAFTAAPYRGNPAAVFLLDGPADEIWMRRVAREMNLSESAFLRREAEGFRLRWFTPEVEVELCGHATLASAWVLFSERIADARRPVAFHTLSGRLLAESTPEGIRLDFPADPVEPLASAPGLAEALGVIPRAVFAARKGNWLVELESEGAVRELSPDFRRLGALEGDGVIVTAPGDGRKYDFVSRYFCPKAGIAEDPVTGSAHCALGPYWGERLGKDRLTGFQASARGGEVGVTLRGDRVELAGRAVTVARGHWIR